MLLIIDAELTAPPSEVCLFRDITLYSSCFLDKEVVIECPKNERDFYYKWLRDRCAWDYVLDMVRPRTELGVTLRSSRANITVSRISYSNYQGIISRLNAFKRK